MAQSTIEQGTRIVTASSTMEGGTRTQFNTAARDYQPQIGRRSFFQSASAFSHGTYHDRTRSQFSTPDGTFQEVRNTREQEKKELRDLNVRLADYIEKTPSLEAQDRKLEKELKVVRVTWSQKMSTVNTMYEMELHKARNDIEERNKEKSRLEADMQNLQDQLDHAREQRAQDRETINKVNEQISDLEMELTILRRTNDSRNREEENLARLNEELEKLKMDLRNVTNQRLDVEHHAQTLAEKLEFNRSVYEERLQELHELQEKTVRVYRDTTAEKSKTWKKELSELIIGIQSEYDFKIETTRTAMETFYMQQVEEFRTVETKKHTTEMTDLSEETKTVVKDIKSKNTHLEAMNANILKQCQDLQHKLDRNEVKHTHEIDHFKEEVYKKTKSLETLTSDKLSLEVEIAAYRKLVETGEKRCVLRTLVEQTLGVRNGEIAVGDTVDNHGASTSCHQTSNGPIAIVETCPDGKFIILENKSSEDVNLSYWSLEREVDDEPMVPYMFPAYPFFIKPDNTLTIWANAYEGYCDAGDLVFVENASWGTGLKITTILSNENHVVMATQVESTT